MPDNYSPFERVNQASFLVSLVRIPSWDVEYDTVNFYRWELNSVFRVEVYDTVDMYFRTAKVYLSDRGAMRQYLPLTGNELITIQYKNLLSPNQDGPEGSTNKIMHFSIESIKEIRNPKEYNKGSNILVLNLVEGPGFQFFTNNAIYKSYSWDGGTKSQYPDRAKSIHEIMNDALLTNPLVSKWYDVEVEETGTNPDDKINFFIPNWSLMKTMNYLKKFAINTKDYPYYVCHIVPPLKQGLKPKIIAKSIYSYMEEAEGVHYYSQTYAHQLYRSPTSQEIDEPARKYEEEEDPYEILNVYKNHGFDYFGRLKTAFAELSGETFATFDYLSDNQYVGYDFESFKTANYKGLGRHGLHGFNYGNQWSAFRPHSFNEPKRLINMKRNQFAKHMLETGFSCTVEGVLNHNRRVGDLADIQFRSSSPKTPEDTMMGGRWLLWGQIDRMMVGAADSASILIKEGMDIVEEVPEGLPQITHINPENKNAPGRGVVDPNALGEAGRA